MESRMMAISPNGYKMAQIAPRIEAGKVISLDYQFIKDHPSSTQITRNREKGRKVVGKNAISAKQLTIEQKTALENNLNQPNSRKIRVAKGKTNAACRRVRNSTRSNLPIN